MAPDAAGVIKRLINFTWKGICSKRSQSNALNAKPTLLLLARLGTQLFPRKVPVNLRYLSSQYICCLVLPTQWCIFFFLCSTVSCFKSFLCLSIKQSHKTSSGRLRRGWCQYSTQQHTSSTLCLSLRLNEVVMKRFIFPGIINSKFKKSS